MTEVAFHFNAPDKLGYACRLLRKAYLKGARLVVLTEEGSVKALDTALWTMAQGEFVPHCHPGDPAHVRARSPIHIGSRIPEGGNAGVLVNLRTEMPANFDQFARVIEVVTLGDDDRQSARERWRQYKALGIEPQRHDLQLAASD